MKALTLTEPWASLVSVGAKRIETRSWDTNYRGLIAIHAAKGFTGDDLDFTRFTPEAKEPLDAAGIIWRGMGKGGVARSFFSTRGMVVAVANLVVTCPLDRWQVGHKMILSTGEEIVLTREERMLGGYGPGRFGFFLTDIHRLPEPIPAKGALGLWNWTPPEGFVLPEREKR